ACPDPNYVVGGVMMGRLEDNHDALVDKTTGGVIVLPADHVVVRRRRNTYATLARIGRAACDQCSFCTELCPRYLLGHPIEPHRAMRSLMFNLAGEVNVRGTSFCCECNLCSMFSCPEDLDPKNVCAENKRRILAERTRWDNPPFNPARPGLLMAGRKIPTAKLMHKLGLAGFSNVGPLADRLMPARRVGIKLKQHVGAPCVPAVAVGAKVRVGDVVGRLAVVDGKPALGAPVHASIAGKVAAIKDGVVWIES
ncbi:MAG: 4Fe-4S dicluster domain-containing protein, partial [Phycisphaerae bacterium]|nr:4Fe-4S dicluster domain-containing protein [Phycisphaerae bacterium]